MYFIESSVCLVSEKINALPFKKQLKKVDAFVFTEYILFMEEMDYKQSRRRALQIISSAIVGVVTFLHARLVLRFLAKPAPTRLNLPEKLPEVTSRFFIVKEQNSIRVLSRKCPHLGCTVNMDLERGYIQCPCHGSRFTLNGRYLQGPARADLKEMAFKIKNRQLIIES